MADLFSVGGLVEKQEAIKDLARKLGFSIDQERLLAPVFLALRPRAPKIIMIISGTHGVEGPTGYDLQMNLLQKKVHEKLPADTGLVFVAALNPWGWANGRRTDEVNVDLNRNGWFGDWPDTPAFTPEISALVHPTKCDEEWYRTLSGILADPVKCASLRAQVFRGQDSDPKGIFYGGKERSRSLRQLESYLHSLLAGCKHLVVLDIHTGLGEFGEIMLISSARPGDDKLIARVKSWFGLTPVFPKLGQTDRVNAVSSDLLFFIAQCLPRVQVTPLAVEIGTVPFKESFPIFVAENRLSHSGGEDLAFLNQGDSCLDQVRREMQRIFYPPSSGEEVEGSNWSTAVRAGFMPIFRTVVQGLSES